MSAHGRGRCRPAPPSDVASKRSYGTLPKQVLDPVAATSLDCRQSRRETPPLATRHGESITRASLARRSSPGGRTAEAARPRPSRRAAPTGAAGARLRSALPGAAAATSAAAPIRPRRAGRTRSPSALLRALDGDGRARFQRRGAGAAGASAGAEAAPRTRRTALSIVGLERPAARPRDNASSRLRPLRASITARTPPTRLAEPQ